MQQKSPVILVDGSSYLYRAFHALPPLTNSKGLPTGAIYGVINMLRKLIRDYEPEYIAVIFDPKGKTFRDDLYKEYKANRPPMPADLSQQVKPLLDVVKTMGLPLVVIDHYEADDVIGTLAVQAVQEGKQVLVSTGDKDMAQLVNDDVTLINTMTNKIMGREGVIEKFGVPPERIIDYLALIGDTVDNVPGVPKVGPKTAVKWLAEYKDLDGIVANADNIKGKVGENLRNSLPDIPLSKELVTIKLDVPLPFDFHELKKQEPDTQSLIQMYQDLEFKNWLSELLSNKETAVVAQSIERNYHTILTEESFKELINVLSEQELIAIDTETTDLNYMKAEIVGISAAYKTGEAYYIPVAHDYLDAPTQLDRAYVLETLKPIIESSSIKKVGHNLKYDISMFSKYGINMQGVAFDTMIEAFLLGSGSRLDMDTLALKYLGHKNISFEEVAGKGAKQITFDKVDIDTATQYAAEDADITLSLHEKLWPMIERDAALVNVLENEEMPLVPILSEIERTGVLIDINSLYAQSEDLGERLTKLQKETFAIAETEFNMNSPKQLQKVLFEDMKLPILKKTPTGQAATSEEVLQELALDYPLPALILQYRSFSKLKSTYTDKLPLLVDKQTGRVHTSYHQVGTATGRFSSSDPNLQNIPVRTEEGRKIRKAFVAPKGYKILAADYSQVELRIMAHLSEDKGLCDAFAQGLDIHKATAAEVFGVSLDDVDNLQRRHAKAINFGLIYGMSAFGLAKQLDVGRSEAQAYIDMYFDRYPGVKRYMEEVREKAHKSGYVETLTGRKLYLPEINSKNKMLMNAAERAAINAPMQGTAADLIKRAMVNVHNMLKQKNMDARIIMQVHDELVFEVAEDLVNDMKVVIPQVMSEAIELHVPLLVDVGVGDNWDEAH